MILLTHIIKEIHGLKSLRVFDFDDTLIKSNTIVYVKHQNGSIDKLTPAQFAAYNEKPGDQFDFSDFKKAIKNPQVIEKNIDILKSSLRNPHNKVTILTARALAFPVRYFLKKRYGLDVYVVALSNGNPQTKANWIENNIRKGYNDILFMDDSIKNIEAVNKLKYKYPNIKLQTIHVKDNMSEEKINEFKAHGFDLDEFLEMNSFASQVRYANEKLKRIAQGSARIVFEIDDKTVLKLAKNSKGIAQNEIERSLSNDYMVPQHIIAKVLEEDDKDRWIVMEQAKKIGKARFKQLMDGISIDDFYIYIKMHTDHHSNLHWHMDSEVEEELNENEFAQDLVEMIINFDLGTGDFSRPSSFGEIDGRLVVTDYGLTNKVFKKHYDKSGK